MAFLDNLLGRRVTSRPFARYAGDRAVWAGRNYPPLRRGVSWGGAYSPNYLDALKRRPRGVSLTTNRKTTASPASKISLLRAPASYPKSTNYLYEDRRLWHPLGRMAYPKSKTTVAPVASDISAQVTEIDPAVWRKISTPPKSIPWTKLAKQSLKNAPATTIYSWENPYKMIICLKRKMRREVMNALGLAGRTGFKKPNYTQYSYVRCW